MENEPKSINSYYYTTHQSGLVPLFKLQPHHIQSMINNLKNHGKKKDKPISYKTRKNVHGCISAALDTAVRIKYVKDNAATGCVIPRDYDNTDENEKDINPFTTEELRAFLEGIKGSRYEDIYNLALDTGCRLSEMLGLRWSRCNIKDSKITIDCQLLIKREKGSVRKLAPTKNTKTRSFKVGKSVISLLQSVKKKQAEKRLAAGAAWQKEIDDLVFTDEIGCTIPHSSIEHEFSVICRKAGITGHRFHDLRHTFATLALQNKADVKTLSKALGHYSVAFTLDVYGHVSDEMQDDFAGIMDSVISAR